MWLLFLELDLGTFCSLLRPLFLIVFIFIKDYQHIFQPLFNIAEMNYDLLFHPLFNIEEI